MECRTFFSARLRRNAIDYNIIILYASRLIGTGCCNDRCRYPKLVQRGPGLLRTNTPIKHPPPPPPPLNNKPSHLENNHQTHVSHPPRICLTPITNDRKGHFWNLHSLLRRKSTSVIALPICGTKGQGNWHSSNAARHPTRHRNQSVIAEISPLRISYCTRSRVSTKPPTRDTIKKDQNSPEPPNVLVIQT